MKSIYFFCNRRQHQQHHMNVRPSTRVQNVRHGREGVVHHSVSFLLFFRNRSQQQKHHLHGHPYTRVNNVQHGHEGRVQHR